MNYMTKSLQALDDFIKNVSQEEKDKILLQVRSMDFEGPTMEEFFTWAIEKQPMAFNFQDDIDFYGMVKPPREAIKVSNKTPKFSAESFFCVTSQYGTKSSHVSA